MDEFLLELDLADAAEKEEASAASSLEQYTKELYTMSVFLEDAGLAKLQQVLHGETLNMYNAQLACGRPEFLLSLNKKGVMALADRQKLANAIAKARRDGRLPTLSTAQPLRYVWHIGMLLDCAHNPAWFMYVRTICTVTYPLHLQLTSVCSSCR